jgi:hypothetical protein
MHLPIHPIHLSIRPKRTSSAAPEHRSRAAVAVAEAMLPLPLLLPLLLFPPPPSAAPGSRRRSRVRMPLLLPLPRLLWSNPARVSPFPSESGTPPQSTKSVLI